MFKQTNTSSPELMNWLDTVARAAIDVFHIHENSFKYFFLFIFKLFFLDFKRGNHSRIYRYVKTEKNKSSMWLVAPLVSRLPSAVQGRILKVAGNVLESTNFFSSASKKAKDENNEDSNESNDGMDKIEKPKAPKLNHQAFLGLVLTCLKGQDEQKEGLLSSLHSQLTQFLQSINEVSNGDFWVPFISFLQLSSLSMAWCKAVN